MSKWLLKAFLVGLAIWIFILMVSSINFSGMKFGEIRLIVSICVGVAVTLIDPTKAKSIIAAAIYGFASGAVAFTLLSWAIQNLIK